MHDIPSDTNIRRPGATDAPATKTVDFDNVIAGMAQVADALNTGHKLTARQEQQLFDICGTLSSRLKETTPQLRISESIPMKIALDMGIFDFVCGSDKDEFTAQEIATATGADPVLVERIMRPLVLSRLFSPTPRNTYKPNQSATHLAPGAYMRDMVIFTQEVTDLVALKLPAFLAEGKYENPDGRGASAFQHTFQTEDPFYTWLQKRPALYSAFCGMMKSTEDLAARWADLFPVHERFERFRGPAAGETLRLVDVAGGRGFNLQYLLDQVPDLKAELTLQDLPEVLGDSRRAAAPAHVHPSITEMPHNFFDVQPVKGAHVYVLTRVLHNWPDDGCRRILRNIKEAMDEDSILLIGDKVFPAGAAEVTSLDVTADLVMMMLFGAMERTENQVRELLAEVGLELVRVWRADGAVKDQEGVLEARVRRG
ncbi:S-adenosyl-L-methionine-dependent methyltransferase [Aspergillus varians]